MSDYRLIVERWRANAAAAGIELPETVVEAAEQGGMLAQVAAWEAMLRRLDPGFTMPDALSRPWDTEDERA